MSFECCDLNKNNTILIFCNIFLDKWPKTQSGLPSTSGTTASVAFVRRGKLYIGHVGDSGIVLGYKDEDSDYWKSKQLTKDHKPENPSEYDRIVEYVHKLAFDN